MLNFEIEWQKNLEQGVLRLPKCDACNHWNWYPVPVCKNCGNSAFEWTQIPLAGTLFSWTRVHRNFTGMDMGPMPYTVGLIDLDGAPGARVPARFLGDNPEKLKLDGAIGLEFQKIGKGVVLCFDKQI